MVTLSKARTPAKNASRASHAFYSPTQSRVSSAFRTASLLGLTATRNTNHDTNATKEKGDIRAVTRQHVNNIILAESMVRS